jgi:hypothetical protein
MNIARARHPRTFCGEQGWSGPPSTWSHLHAEASVALLTCVTIASREEYSHMVSAAKGRKRARRRATVLCDLHHTPS